MSMGLWGKGLRLWVRCKATPPYSPAIYNPMILLLIYYLIIWLFDNSSQANDYTFVDRLIIYDAIRFFWIWLPLCGFFDFNWYYCLLLYYLDWLLADYCWIILIISIPSFCITPIIIQSIYPLVISPII